MHMNVCLYLFQYKNKIKCTKNTVYHAHNQNKKYLYYYEMEIYAYVMVNDTKRETLYRNRMVADTSGCIRYNILMVSQ